MNTNILRRPRFWNVLFRTLHLAAFGLLLGGYTYGVESARMTPALSATITTGALLVMLELRQDVRWPFLGKGLFVLAKLVLLVLVPVFPGARVPLLVAVVVLAGVGSHMPREFRHYSVLERRVVSCPGERRVAIVSGHRVPPGEPLSPMPRKTITIEER